MAATCGNGYVFDKLPKKKKCLPVLLYGLEVCPLTVSNLCALDFVVNEFFMKLFTTNVFDTVKIRQGYFNFDLPSSITDY